MPSLAPWSRAAALLALLAGSAPAGEGPRFHMPRDGESVERPRVLSVTGEEITRVTFAVDGAIVKDMAEGPFEWTLDPAAFSGRHVVAVTAYWDQTLADNTVTLEFPGDRAIVFSAPAEGASVEAPFDLAASGERVTSARFRLDGIRLHEDAEAPFAFRLDPGRVFEGDHVLLVEAIFAGGSRTHRCTFRTVRPLADRLAPDAVLAAIRALKPGEWYEITGTPLRAASPSPDITPNVMGPWSGGAYDTKRDRLLVWGGGHGDYNGNEIYAFDMKDFRWVRLTDPSPFPPGDPYNAGDKGAHPDGAPISRHTYDYIEYVPAADRFFVGGGAGIWRGGQFSDPMTYLFDFDARKWTQHGECPCRGLGATSAVGPDGRVWMHGSYGREALLAAFDAKTSEWTRYADYGSWIGYAGTAEIDPRENKYVLIGGGEVRIWDLSNPDRQHVLAKTTGATEGQKRTNPGAAYDPKTKEIVVWPGGATVYGLDVASLRWTAYETSGSNTTPPSPAGGGTYGRWRYVPSLDVFVVVNNVRGNVFVYRHS